MLFVASQKKHSKTRIPPSYTVGNVTWVFFRSKSLSRNNNSPVNNEAVSAREVELNVGYNVELNEEASEPNGKSGDPRPHLFPRHGR